MKPASGALAFLAALSLVGCSRNAELEKARAEADAAKTELAKVRAELDQLKAQRAAHQSEEDMVMEVGKEFVELLRARRSDSLALSSARADADRHIRIWMGAERGAAKSGAPAGRCGLVPTE